MSLDRSFFIYCLSVVAVFGLCIGSFLNVVVYRLPRGESLVVTRSHCPTCGHTLAWYDLVPFFSYLFLRGRCRYCQTTIPLRYPLMELLTAALFAGTFLKFGLQFALLKYLFLCALLIAVTFIDLESLIIPDRLVVTGLVAWLILGLPGGDVGIIPSLIGSAVTSGFLLLVTVASKGGMGGGDVKLGLVTGLFLGWPLGPLGLFLGICLGGVFAAFLLATRLKSRKEPIPFGPFIAAGTLMALFCGGQLLAWYWHGLLKPY